MTEALVRSKTSVFRGDYYAHGKQFVTELPIRRIDFSNNADVALHARIVATVRTLNDLVSKRASSSSKSDAELYTRSIAAAERNLKSDMDMLYGVPTGLEGAVMS